MDWVVQGSWNCYVSFLPYFAKIISHVNHHRHNCIQHLGLLIDCRCHIVVSNQLWRDFNTKSFRTFSHISLLGHTGRISFSRGFRTKARPFLWKTAVHHGGCISTTAIAIKIVVSLQQFSSHTVSIDGTFVAIDENWLYALTSSIQAHSCFGSTTLSSKFQKKLAFELTWWSSFLEFEPFLQGNVPLI